MNGKVILRHFVVIFRLTLQSNLIIASTEVTEMLSGLTTSLNKLIASVAYACYITDEECLHVSRLFYMPIDVKWQPYNIGFLTIQSRQNSRFNVRVCVCLHVWTTTFEQTDLRPAYPVHWFVFSTLFKPSSKITVTAQRWWSHVQHVAKVTGAISSGRGLRFWTLLRYVVDTESESRSISNQCRMCREPFFGVPYSPIHHHHQPTDRSHRHPKRFCVHVMLMTLTQPHPNKVAPNRNTLSYCILWFYYHFISHQYLLN